MGPRRGGSENSYRGAFGKWWTNPAVIRRLGLTNDQQRKFEEIFQQNRLKLIDLTASLAKEEAILDPLLGAEHLQESKVLTQIDRVADARSALEKANSRMLYSFRILLTPEQWKDLQSPGADPRSRQNYDRPRPPGR